MAYAQDRSTKIRSRADDKRIPRSENWRMALLALSIATVVTAAMLFGLLLRHARQAFPHRREIDDALTDREVEELIRQELYGRRLNVSRRA